MIQLIQESKRIKYEENDVVVRTMEEIYQQKLNEGTQLLTASDWNAKLKTSKKVVPVATVAFFPGEQPSMAFHRSPNSIRHIDEMSVNERNRIVNKTILPLMDALVHGDAVNMIMHTERGRKEALHVLKKHINAQQRKAVQKYRKDISSRFTLSALIAFKGIKVSKNNFKLITQCLTKTSIPEAIRKKKETHSKKTQIPQVLFNDIISAKIHDLYVEGGGVEKVSHTMIANELVKWIKSTNELDNQLKNKALSALVSSQTNELHSNSPFRVISVYKYIQLLKLEWFKEEILTEVEQLGGLDDVEKLDAWSGIAVKFQDMNNFIKVDCNYFIRYAVYNWYCKVLPEERRDSYRKLYVSSLGIPMPKIISMKALNLELHKHIYGQWSILDKKFMKKSDIEWITLFKHDPLCTYVGEPINKIVDVDQVDEDDLFVDVETFLENILEKNPKKEQQAIGTILDCRVVDMRVNFIQLITILEEMKAFKDESKEVEWLCIDWLDGAPINGCTLLLGLIFFFVNNDVFKSDFLERAMNVVQRYL